MKYALISLLITGASLWGGNQQAVLQPVEFNVNSRYTVESVELPREVESRISRGLRRDLQRLIGQKFNTQTLNDLARRVRQELNLRTVSQKVIRGTAPDHVRVVLEVAHKRGEFDLSVPRFLYHSTEGLSASVDGNAVLGNNRFSFGLVSDGDELSERYAGVRARYENRKIGSDRVHLRFEFDSYHDQWNRSTVNANGSADAAGGLYRSRQNIEPLAAILITKSLTLSFGAGFQRFDSQLPPARTQSANAAITSLRYERRIEGWGADQHELDAGYSLRAATRMLNSDFSYARHRWSVRYGITRGRQSLTDEAVAGLITGRAPLFERYVLGTSSMLRGWNKYDLDPLGGSRVAYNSLDYRYGMVDVFYDTGAIWDPGQDAVARHSLGVGLRKNSFMVAMAFPVKGGRVSPMFMVGMNY
ncbi:MAG TPA: BamA/TamA family outer membrane protein [Bryobacteraceae bacterium]|jgi:outer membrane protein assembly factor BamA|nr:BamA/TamA family outer membrane protein [Bryobacteraceae bacterium]